MEIIGKIIEMKLHFQILRLFKLFNLFSKLFRVNQMMQIKNLAKYIDRLKKFENWSLYEFGKKVNAISKSYEKRKVEAIVRVFSIVNITGHDIEDEKYKIKCILH